MRTRRILLVALILAAVSLPGSDVATAQVPPPAPVPPTLWSFMGIPQAYYKMRNAAVNRRGNFPGLEAKPPLKGIADPKNLESPFEPIKVAAEVKQAEDAAPQKIKGIKYLAKIGCGCYNKEGNKVTNAMKAGLNDCTEEVRMATVEAIAEAAEDEACAKCGQRSCCKEELTLELAKLAYERDDHGCYVESSADVREAAVAALQICCPNTIPVTVLQEESPGPKPEREVGEPTPAETAEPAPELPGQADSNADGGNDDAPVDDPSASNEIGMPGMSAPELSAARQTRQDARLDIRLENYIRTGAQGCRAGQVPSNRHAQSSRRKLVSGQRRNNRSKERSNANHIAKSTDTRRIRGVVERVDVANGFVTIQPDKGVEIPVGTSLNVYHRYLLGEHLVGEIEVVQSSKNSVHARSVDRGPLRNVSGGDQIRGK